MLFLSNFVHMAVFFSHVISNVYGFTRVDNFLEILFTGNVCFPAYILWHNRDNTEIFTSTKMIDSKTFLVGEEKLSLILSCKAKKKTIQLKEIVTF